MRTTMTISLLSTCAELFNLLVNPLENDYALSWHRDDVRAEASAEEEEIALGKDHHGVQWNAALYDDGQCSPRRTCMINLLLILSASRLPESSARFSLALSDPGRAVGQSLAGPIDAHARRTDSVSQERTDRLLQQQHRAQGTGASSPLETTMQSGDGAEARVFLTSQYNLEVKRRTLHGCYGSPPPGDTTRGPLVSFSS